MPSDPDPDHGPPLEALAGGARSILGRELTPQQLGLFSKYLILLQKWQRTQRLVGSVDPAWIINNLFLDSLLFERLLPAGLKSLADVGSGAGFPGIPIKIVLPAVSVALLEPRERRASFLSAAVRELGLGGTRVVRQRAREAAVAGERFDAVVMRCAGDLSSMMPEAVELLASGGVVIASGPPSRRELALGDWVEVPGIAPRTTRRFAVFRPDA